MSQPDPAFTRFIKRHPRKMATLILFLAGLASTAAWKGAGMAFTGYEASRAKQGAVNDNLTAATQKNADAIVSIHQALERLEKNQDRIEGKLDRGLEKISERTDRILEFLGNRRAGGEGLAKDPRKP